MKKILEKKRKGGGGGERKERNPPLSPRDVNDLLSFFGTIVGEEATDHEGERVMEEDESRELERGQATRSNHIMGASTIAQVYLIQITISLNHLICKQLYGTFNVCCLSGSPVLLPVYY